MSELTEGHCEDALTELYGFLDGELDDALRAKIERHLLDCSPCLEAFDFEADLKRVIAQKCRDHVPDSLRMRIAEALSLDP